MSTDRKRAAKAANDDARPTHAEAADKSIEAKFANWLEWASIRLGCAIAAAREDGRQRREELPDLYGDPDAEPETLEIEISTEEIEQIRLGLRQVAALLRDVGR